MIGWVHAAAIVAVTAAAMGVVVITAITARTPWAAALIAGLGLPAVAAAAVTYAVLQHLP